MQKSLKWSDEELAVSFILNSLCRSRFTIQNKPFFKRLDFEF
jgi:hypothetical protein